LFTFQAFSRSSVTMDAIPDDLEAQLASLEELEEVRKSDREKVLTNHSHNLTLYVSDAVVQKVL
jgi:hypothetical protein